MYKVTNGAVHHKGEVYRKGAILPESFTNKPGYKHVELVPEKKTKKKADK